MLIVLFAKIRRNILSLSLKDLRDLISNKTGESEILDYKRALPKDDLLKIVCAGANTKGVRLFIGIKEKGGFPIELIGIEVPNQEEFERERNQKIKNHITPFIDGIKYFFIELPETDLYVVCIDIPQSNLVHACTFNENVIYYKRVGAQNMQFSPFELKNKFSKEDPKKLFASHIQSRITAIEQGKCHIANVKFQQNPFFLIHAKPISIPELNLSKEIQNELCRYIGEYHLNGVEIKHCYEGLYVKFRSHHHLIFHRNGHIEFAGLAGEKLEIRQPIIEERFKTFFYKILSIIDKSQGLSPLLFSYTLNNAKGLRLFPSNNSPMPPSWVDYQEPLKRESYLRISAPYDIFKEDGLALYKDLFDPIWNDAGIEESPYHHQIISL